MTPHPALWTTTKQGAKQMKISDTRKRAAKARRKALAMKPRKRIPAVSKGQRVRNAAYSARVKVWKLENPICRACKMASSPAPAQTDDCHHKRGRLGPLLMDERHWIPLCRTHHNWVRDNPSAARFLGLLAPRGEWHKPTP